MITSPFKPDSAEDVIYAWPPREVGMLTVGPACAISRAVAVAVGGGGQNYDAHDDGGSGSGYVEFLEFNVSAALMQFEAVVGSGTIAK